MLDPPPLVTVTVLAVTPVGTVKVMWLTSTTVNLFIVVLPTDTPVVPKKLSPMRVATFAPATVAVVTVLMTGFKIVRTITFCELSPVVMAKLR